MCAIASSYIIVRGRRGKKKSKRAPARSAARACAHVAHRRNTLTHTRTNAYIVQGTYVRCTMKTTRCSSLSRLAATSPGILVHNSTCIRPLLLCSRASRDDRESFHFFSTRSHAVNRTTQEKRDQDERMRRFALALNGPSSSPAPHNTHL